MRSTLSNIPAIVAIHIFLGCLIVSGSFAADYQFVSIKGLVEQEVGRIILPEVYKKLGLTIEITPMPGKRAEKQAASGDADGEIMRIWSYGEENPTLIRVPTPYYHLETTAFVRAGSGIVIRDREDLTNYTLVKVRGVKHTDNVTLGLSRVFEVENSDQLMQFLQFGRADVALTNTIDGLRSLQRNNTKGIVALEGPLATLELYHYIHVKHMAIVDKVDGVLQDMIQTGEMQRLIESAKTRIFSQP